MSEVGGLSDDVLLSLPPKSCTRKEQNICGQYQTKKSTVLLEGGSDDGLTPKIMHIKKNIIFADSIRQKKYSNIRQKSTVNSDKKVQY